MIHVKRKEVESNVRMQSHLSVIFHLENDAFFLMTQTISCIFKPYKKL